MQLETDQLHSHWLGVCAVDRVWLVDSVVNLETFDHIVWCLGLTLSVCVL
jgi:hypothetical protein